MSDCPAGRKFLDSTFCPRRSTARRWGIASRAGPKLQVRRGPLIKGWVGPGRGTRLPDKRLGLNSLTKPIRMYKIGCWPTAVPWIVLWRRWPPAHHWGFVSLDRHNVEGSSMTSAIVVSFYQRLQVALDDTTFTITGDLRRRQSNWCAVGEQWGLETVGGHPEGRWWTYRAGRLPSCLRTSRVPPA